MWLARWSKPTKVYMLMSFLNAMNLIISHRLTKGIRSTRPPPFSIVVDSSLEWERIVGWVNEGNDGGLECVNKGNHMHAYLPIIMLSLLGTFFFFLIFPQLPLLFLSFFLLPFPFPHGECDCDCMNVKVIRKRRVDGPVGGQWPRMAWSFGEPPNAQCLSTALNHESHPSLRNRTKRKADVKVKDHQSIYGKLFSDDDDDDDDANLLLVLTW